MFETPANSVIGNYMEQSKRAKALNVPFWILQVLLAAAFLINGALQLANARTYLTTIDKVSVGQWLTYATGGVEVFVAALLLIPRTAALGAAVLALTMIGAVTTHLLVPGGSPAHAIVLLVIAATVSWYRTR